MTILQRERARLQGESARRQADQALLLKVAQLARRHDIEQISSVVLVQDHGVDRDLGAPDGRFRLVADRAHQRIEARLHEGFVQRGMTRTNGARRLRGREEIEPA
ncbi:hypothetical protein [Bradyrhizobium sp. LB13.1]